MITGANSPVPSVLMADVSLLLQSAQELHEWIVLRLNDLQLGGSNSRRIPALLFDLAIEHHVGIVQLVKARIYGSAFALIRPQFEAFTRGLWFQLCANQNEIDRFAAKDELGINLGQMLLAIEGKPDFSDQILSSLKKNTWNAMSGYTHGGMHQVVRRISGNSIEPNYEPEELIEVLKTAGSIGLMALRQIACLAGNLELSLEVSNKIASAN